MSNLAAVDPEWPGWLLAATLCLVCGPLFLFWAGEDLRPENMRRGVQASRKMARRLGEPEPSAASIRRATVWSVLWRYVLMGLFLIGMGVRILAQTFF